MADDLEIIPRQPDEFDVTGQELADYLSFHCPAMKCPACGSEKVPLLSADSAEGKAHLSAMYRLYPRTQGGDGCCVAYCQHCQYVWLFNADAVLEWAHQQRKLQGGQGE